MYVCLTQYWNTMSKFFATFVKIFILLKTRDGSAEHFCVYNEKPIKML